MVYTYDDEADALYVLLVPDADAAIRRTVEIDERVHVDLDDSDRVVGVEILNPNDGDNGLHRFESGSGSTSVSLSGSPLSRA